MVGVKNHKVYFYKLRPQGGTAPSFLPILKKSLANLRKNPLINESQIKSIYQNVNVRDTRIMSCILKPFTEHNDTVNEYYVLLREIAGKLGNGVFIFNLTDAIILREDGAEPFPYVYGHKMMDDRRFQYGEFLPILGGGQIGYLDIPIVNYDEVIRIVNNTFVDYLNIYQLDWDKKSPRAIFRGGPSGCGASSETNMRLRLAILSKTDPRFSKWVDACIVGKGERVIKYDPIYGLSKVRTKDIEAALCADQAGTPMTVQSTYKYIIHVDGNVGAYRLLGTMLTGSLILRVKSPYLHWADHMLRAGVHYIEVAPDLSNLIEVIEWCGRHDRRCREMAAAGMQAAAMLISRNFVEGVFVEYLNDLSGRLGPTPATPPNLPTPPPTTPPPTKYPDDIIMMPATNRCPRGYGRVNLGGVEVCKKKVVIPLPTPTPPMEPSPPQNIEAARAILEIAKPIEELVENYNANEFVPYIDGKRCPKGYHVTTIKAQKICRRKLTGGGRSRRTRRATYGGAAAPPQSGTIESLNLQNIRDKATAIRLAMAFIIPSQQSL